MTDPQRYTATTRGGQVVHYREYKGRIQQTRPGIDTTWYNLGAAVQLRTFAASELMAIGMLLGLGAEL